MVQYTTEQSGDGNVSERVVAAVADARDVDPLELPPLFNVVNPDALDQLFTYGHSDEAGVSEQVVFTFAGYKVVVQSDGEVTVTAPSDHSLASSATDPGDALDEADYSAE